MLPILKAEKTKTKKYVVDFKGLNYGEGWQDGELVDSENVSSVLYPSLTQCYAKIPTEEYPWAELSGSVDAVTSKNGLIVIKPPYIYHGENRIYAYPHLSYGRKHIASVGDLVLIFPDKCWYNSVTGEVGRMEESLKAIGAVFTDSTITVQGASFPFRVGDGVTISGCTQNVDNNKTVIIRAIENGKLSFYENTLKPGTESGEVTFKRAIPDMDVICESGYRLWGAKGSTIYASKYGDPLNFNVGDGLASDSYAIEVGTEGDFTGAAPYGGHICFFKENYLHKMFGTKPANYQLNTAIVHGVQKGSERSLVQVNDVLYYKGLNGVYAYGGGVPELISSSFSERRFSNACAASDGDRYYISMQRMFGDGTYDLMVYDIRRGIWMREGKMRCFDMTFADGYVWLLAEESHADGASQFLYKVDPNADRSKMKWSITFCPFNETANERKGYSKFMIRAEMAEGAWLKLEYKRDDCGRWQEAFAVENTKRKTMWFPVMPERCDSVQIRISGKGECIIRSFVREFDVGSDV